MRKNAGSIIGVHCGCPIAICHLQGCRFFYEPRTKELNDVLLSSASGQQHGQIRPSIWPFGSEPDRVFQDTLHWAMGLSRTMSDAVLDICPVAKRDQMVQLFKKAGVGLQWTVDKTSQEIKRTNFHGKPLDRILQRLDIEEAHAIAGFSLEKIQTAGQCWTLVTRLIFSASCLPDERPGYIEPPHFKFFADALIFKLRQLYGAEYLACYTHNTTDHIAAQLNYLRTIGISLSSLGCQSLELRNQVSLFLAPS